MLSVTSEEWAEFLNKIMVAKRELGNPETIWYRGQNDARHYLLPSLLRYENGLEKERFLFNSFVKFSDRILQRRESEWETLFEMQHYGLPTRLLDWSETFGIALFFAAYYNDLHEIGGDAAIYLLAPEKLNRIALKRETIYRVPRDEDDFPYTKIYWDHRPFPPHARIAIEPIFINDRMLAQRGVFTVHHDEIDPIEDKFPEAIKKIIVREKLIPAALEFLDLSNITRYSVFPDLAGIAGFLKRTSGLSPR